MGRGGIGLRTRVRAHKTGFQSYLHDYSLPPEKALHKPSHSEIALEGQCMLDVGAGVGKGGTQTLPRSSQFGSGREVGRQILNTEK